jgi:hypothetical protein
VRPRTRVAVGGLLAAALTVVLIGGAFALPVGAPPPDAIPFLEIDGEIYYVPADQVPDGIPPELLEQLPTMTEEERLNALEAAWQAQGATSTVYEGGGSSLSGEGGAMCGGWAYSFDDNNVMIDAAFDAGDDAPPVSLMGGGQAFTSDNPYTVHNNGSVMYVGFATPPPINHTWEVSVSAFGTDITVDSGGHPNEGEHNRNLGFVDLGQDFPLKINFTVKVSGSMTADGGFLCSGSGWVEVTGENNPLVMAALLLTGLAGFVGILFNARPARTWKG